MVSKKNIKGVKKYSNEIVKTYSALENVRKNKPQKYDATQRTLVNKGYLKPKKRFTKGKSPLQFTKKGYDFYKKTQQYKTLVKKIIKKK